MSDASSETPKRERILDAAESLFAEHGFDGVALRTIAREAGVDVALASYYYGRKQDLFEAVVMRRAEMLNSARREALHKAIAESGGTPTVERIIEAFLRPLELMQGQNSAEWRHYMALVAYINNSPRWGRELMSPVFDELVREFIEELRKAIPGASDVDLYWCYHNMSGALTLTLADTGRIDNLSRGVCHSDDFKAAYDRMIPFIAAGFRQVCGTQESPISSRDSG